MTKVIVHRGETVEVKGRYIKIYYGIETDVADLKDIDVTKDMLEKVITGWINQAKQENGTFNDPISWDDVPKPKKGSGVCAICGKPINPKYYQCYDCFKKHQR
ncbi:hypothetical protein HXY33_05530 [Candidatus Bathyarchaeota archaeon]|nr:hypothetical protein [Candidatus Bathyarchaeota archaeon]